MMTDDETAEQDELEAQFRTATEGLQRTMMRLVQDGDIHPHVMVLALARVTGEVGAGTALAEEGGPEGLRCELAEEQDPEELLADLAEVVRQAGREFRDELQAEALPTAGSS